MVYKEGDRGDKSYKGYRSLSIAIRGLLLMVYKEGDRGDKSDKGYRG
jgi:hypothetical protein